jgi:hypothetical protein
MKSGGTLSIWFFIGVSLVVNGALICGAGIYQLIHPPQNPVVLFEVHAPIWWGGLLFVLGVIYCFHFSPGRERARLANPKI